MCMKRTFLLWAICRTIWQFRRLMVRTRYWMERSRFLFAAFFAITLATAARAEPIPVTHIQLPRHATMVARSENGKIIARVEFTETVQGDEVTMRLTYHFLDGSIDDETTTYSQRGTFRLIRNHHIQNGPFFATPVDFTVEAATGTATSRITDKNGKTTRRELAHRPAG